MAGHRRGRRRARRGGRHAPRRLAQDEPGPPVEHSTPGPGHAQTSPTAWRRPVLGLALVAGVVLAVALGTAIAWRPAGASRIARAEVNANGLVAWNAEGQVAFSIPARALIPPDIASSAVPELFSTHAPLVDDFDGDGSVEVVALLCFRKDRHVASDEVVAYSDAGVLKWRYRIRRRLRFGDRDFDGLWRVTDRLVTRDADGRLRLFLAVIDDVWWPSFIVSLNANGVERLHHVNAGHLYKLQHLQTPTANLLLASGVNNEYKSAHLVAVDPGAPPSVSPQSHASFTCQTCTGGPPVHYLLFPPTELGLLQRRPYNLGDTVGVTGSSVEVSILETGEPTARSHYRLSHTLDVLSFGMSDVYWTLHNGFEQKGEITHPASRCEDAVSRVVRAWTPDGWRQIAVRGDGAPE